MKVKTFKAATMAEALASVKREFGNNAVILSTRTIDKGKVFGLVGGEAVEITAAEDESELPPALKGGGVKSRMPERRPLERPVDRRVPSRVEAALGREPDDRLRPLSPPSDALVAEVGELKSLIQRLVKQNQGTNIRDLPDGLFATYQSLIKNAVAENLAEKLVVDVRRNLGGHTPASPAKLQEALAQVLGRMLPLAEPIEHRSKNGPTIVALVGPTGVGKTTTIAKLAANLCLREQKKVGLITIDTYRIAAAEQLRTYAEIINLPISVASSPEQLRLAVQHMYQRDILLIDTAGRSQRDTEKIDELSSYFELVRPHEVHLVLSGAGGKACLEETIKRFSVVGIDRVIFTKLDEAVGFGVLLECLETANARLSYLTTGQDVPNDIEAARIDRVAELLLSGGAARPHTSLDRKRFDRTVR